MPLIRTDDMTLRQVWLGFPGFTFWVEWTYTRWFLTIAVFHVTGPGFFLLFGLVTSSLVFGVFAGLVCGVTAAVRIAGWITKSLSFDEPVMYRLAVLREAWRLARKPAVLVPSRIEITTPKARGLGAGAARSLR